MLFGLSAPIGTAQAVTMFVPPDITAKGTLIVRVDARYGHQLSQLSTPDQVPQSGAAC
jgi:hypothetical protein